jgi:hypothetical protein
MGAPLSQDIDLQIAFEHGLMALAGILYVSSSPCGEDDFRRLLARVRRDADIAAHYARRYLESGGPMPQRSLFEELALLQEERAAEASAGGAECRREPATPRPGPEVLPFSKAGRLGTASASSYQAPPVPYQYLPPKALAPSRSIQELSGALRLVIQGLQMFRQERESSYLRRRP